MTSFIPAPSDGSHGVVAHSIRSRIRDVGRITFAEFMHMALYDSVGGYYATRSPLGPTGDFYTAPLTHPAFGALISRQLENMWEIMGRPSPFWFVEVGSGDGQLAVDILSHSSALNGEFASCLSYVAVDCHPPLIDSTQSMEWVESMGIPFRNLTGCILANELLDAMPVHRVTVHNGLLREIYITLGPGDEFQECLGDISTTDLIDRLAPIRKELQEHQTIEVNLAQDSWLRQVSESLENGYLILIDYGYEADEHLRTQRRNGTLRCYYRHTENTNPYVRVGKQDMGAHVEFSSVRRVAQEYGFSIAGTISQAEFLSNLGLQRYREDIESRGDLSGRTRRANLEALDTLDSVNGMGNFKVMILQKRPNNDSLIGFHQSILDVNPNDRAPLLTNTHMPPAGVDWDHGNMPSWDELIT